MPFPAAMRVYIEPVASDAPVAKVVQGELPLDQYGRAVDDDHMELCRGTGGGWVCEGVRV